MGGLLIFAGGLLMGATLPSLLRKRERITVDEEGHWRFPIGTLRQMLAIPPERRERFLAELPDMFRQMWGLLDRFPMSTLPGSVWVDDGLGEFRPEVVNAPESVRGEFAPRPLNGER